MEDKDASDYVLLLYDGDLVTRDSSMQMSSMIQEVEVEEFPPSSSPFYTPPLPSESSIL